MLGSRFVGSWLIVVSPYEETGYEHRDHEGDEDHISNLTAVKH